MADFIDETQVETLLKQLNQLRDELGQEATALQHASEPVNLDQQAFGRVSRGDALQQQSMAKANLRQCQERIQLIEEALQKIDNEEYGFCEGCGELISFARLSARPESLYCLKCQQEHES